LTGSLPIAAGALATLTVNRENMARALVPEMLSTDLAEYLVRKGVPFRETHHVAGAAVALAESQGTALTELTLEALRNLHSAFEEDVTSIWSYERSVEQRDAHGGSSRRAVQAQIDELLLWLGQPGPV